MTNVHLILAESIDETNNPLAGLHGTLVRLTHWQEFPDNVDWATARCKKYELLYANYCPPYPTKLRYINNVPVYDTYWTLVTNSSVDFLENLPSGTKFEVTLGFKK